MTRRNPDLVLVNPASRTQVYQSLGKRLAAVENPVWAGLMATFVRRKGFSVEIIDAEAEELTPDEAAERVATSIRVWPPSSSTGTSRRPRRRS